MKLFLKTLMMAVCSISIMTLLSLGITQLHAQEVKAVSTEKVTNSQKELVDLFFAAATMK